MAISSMHQLFIEELRDMYHAEKQLTKALPKMAKAASDSKLKEAFESHAEETEGQVERLEKVFESLDERTKGRHCEAMEGLIEEAKEIICRIGSLFYGLGWVTGTGGGLSLRHADRIYMAPSGVQKEHISPDMVFTLDLEGRVLDGPDPDRGLGVSQCRPLFLHAYHQRGAGAVLHSHSIHALLVTLLYERDFVCTHLEMQKGLAGVGYRDRVRVPIIDNTPHESDLADTLGQAVVAAEERCHAVLVRRHGVYVWGRDWIAAKRHAECYDYLFQVALEMKRLGLDPTAEPGA